MAGWITINGAHIYIKDGEDVAAAFERTTGQKLNSSGTSNPDQRADAKKFSINDALRKAAEDKMNPLLKERGQKWIQGKDKEFHELNGKIDAIKEDEIDSRTATEAGHFARIDRENKAKEDAKAAETTTEKTKTEKVAEKLSKSANKPIKEKIIALKDKYGNIDKYDDNKLTALQKDIEKIIGRKTYFDGGDLVDEETSANIGAYFDYYENGTHDDFFNDIANYESSEFYQSVKTADNLKTELAKIQDDTDAQQKCMDLISSDRGLSATCKYELEKERDQSIEYAKQHFKGKDRATYIQYAKDDHNDLINALESGDMENVWRLDTIVRDQFWRAAEATAKAYGSKKK